MAATPLRLHHIGEPLVATLLRRLASQGRLDQLECWAPGGRKFPFSVFCEKNGFSGELAFIDNVPVLNVELDATTYGIDGESQIDCLATDGTNGFGIEIKMGTTRMGTLEFTRRFMKSCKPSHPNDETPRLAGNMIRSWMVVIATPGRTIPVSTYLCQDCVFRLFLLLDFVALATG